MKRFIALSLVLVMALAMFSGCAKTETEETTKAGETGKTETTQGTTTTEGKKMRTDVVYAGSADIITLDP